MKQKKEKKITPYYPMPFRSENTLIKTYKEEYVDPIGNKAIITYADFNDKKGKLVTKYTLYIKWY
jgi:hypothetical protein